MVWFGLSLSQHLKKKEETKPKLSCPALEMSPFARSFSDINFTNQTKLFLLWDINNFKNYDLSETFVCTHLTVSSIKSNDHRHKCHFVLLFNHKDKNDILTALLEFIREIL